MRAGVPVAPIVGVARDGTHLGVVPGVIRRIGSVDACAFRFRGAALTIAENGAKIAGFVFQIKTV